MRGPYPLTEAEPRTFAGLMELYEANYERLRRLIPDLSAVSRRAVSRVRGGLDLHLEVVEHHKYTTVIWLSYYFEEADGLVADPAVEIRIYHDARQAEVGTCSRRRHTAFDEAEAATTSEVLERKWEINRFLHKWLGYCIAQGHRFRRAHRTADASVASAR